MRTGRARLRHLPALCPLAPATRVLMAASLLAVLSSSGASLASPPPPDTGPAVEAGSESSAGFEGTITVTATRGPREVKEVPGTVTVIAADEIERGLMTRLGDLVRHLPGISVADSPGREGESGFVIRGIGGNRVLTRTDGVAGVEEFQFSRLSVPQIGFDLDTVASLEIVRGGHSALYGGDALGGVVSVLTKDPRHFLGGERSHLTLGGGWDGRDDGFALSGAAALGHGPWQLSLNAAGRLANASSSQGRVATADVRRTVANPQSQESWQALTKAVRALSDANELKLVLDHYRRSVDTELESSQGVVDFGRIFGFPPQVTFRLDRSAVDGRDEQRRSRLSLEQGWVDAGPLDHLLWRAWAQSGDSRQTTDELLTTSFGGGVFGPVVDTRVARSGLLTFEQNSVGGETQVREAFRLGGRLHLLTVGASYQRDRFDQWRDSRDLDLDLGREVSRSDELIFPTKYFPATDVSQLGVYGQAELDLLEGRLSLVPGLRWDDHRLDADQLDATYLSGNLGTLEPVDLAHSALTPRLGLVARLGHHLRLRAQIADGFRAPPFSHVNGGFTHLAGSLTRLPNPGLRPETSRGLELGARLDFGSGFVDLVAFEARYEDFIELVPLGVNPTTGFSEFQQQNVARAVIRGWELGGELRPGERWRLRASAGRTEGTDRVAGQPLLSVEPAAASLRAAYTDHRRGWGAELALTATAAKRRSDLPVDADQFAPPASELLDLTAHYRLSDRLTLRLAAFNLLDQTHWSWPSVLGQAATAVTIERYSSPGRSGAATLRFTW